MDFLGNDSSFSLIEEFQESQKIVAVYETGSIYMSVTVFLAHGYTQPNSLVLKETKLYAALKDPRSFNAPNTITFFRSSWSYLIIKSLLTGWPSCEPRVSLRPKQILPT